MADAVDCTSTPSQKKFVYFYEFLPECVKDWYSPSDDEWLLTMLQEQLHKWQQDEDGLPLVTNAQLQNLEDPLVDLKPAVTICTTIYRRRSQVSKKECNPSENKTGHRVLLASLQPVERESWTETTECQYPCFLKWIAQALTVSTALCP